LLKEDTSLFTAAKWSISSSSYAAMGTAPVPSAPPEDSMNAKEPSWLLMLSVLAVRAAPKLRRARRLARW
jgi:hypothetical protein